MYWDDVLDFCQGIMTFEALDNSRITPPMTDSAGLTKYNQNLKNQLKGIWDMMFPKAFDLDAETEERRQEFIRDRAMYKNLGEKINRERGHVAK